MNSLRLTYALIRIPRLFGFLFLFPILLGLLLVSAQLVVTGIFIEGSRAAISTGGEPDPSDFNEREFLLRFLYGENQPGNLRICRWVMGTRKDGRPIERPPERACAPDRLDAALQVSAPADFNPQDYVPLFEGNVQKLHICRSCAPDIIIKPEGEEPTSQVKSVWGLLVLTLAGVNEEIRSGRSFLRKEFRNINERLGEKELYLTGFRHPVHINDFPVSAAVVLNVAALIVITLWLALKAHRRVLDYFARNGALLPMVAACRKNAFYLGIWLLTGLRVTGFLLAALPFTVYWLFSLMEGDAARSLFGGDMAAMLVWMLTVVCGFGLATIVASIAELKQRRVLFAFTYRYLPLIVSAAGALLWLATFPFDGDLPSLIRNIIAALPVFGLAPVIVAPIVSPPLETLVIHALASLMLLIFAARHNADWFSAHLEEI